MLLPFSDTGVNIIQTSLLQKVSGKKIVSMQSYDKKRFRPLIFSNNVLTVIFVNNAQKNLGHTCKRALMF